MDLWSTVAAERLQLADLLQTLTPEQWATPSLCGAWTVREVAAHLVLPHRPASQVLPRFALDMLRARGRFARANVLGTARVAAWPTEEIVTGLRRAAKSRFVAPTLPPIAALAEVLVHGQDIRIPLGVRDHGDPAAWEAAMGFLLTPAARRGFVGKGLPELTWTATDSDYRSGSGAPGSVVQGPIVALSLAVMGRPALLEEISGPGLAALRAWLDRRR